MLLLLVRQGASYDSRPILVALGRHAIALATYFDHADDNVFHFIDGYSSVYPHAEGERVRGTVHVLVYEQSIGPPETLVHECGHVFGMMDFGEGHLDHANLFPDLPADALPEERGCIMLYRDGVPPDPFFYDRRGDGYAQFGGPCAPGVDPRDLRDDVAAKDDPIR